MKYFYFLALFCVICSGQPLNHLGLNEDSFEFLNEYNHRWLQTSNDAPQDSGINTEETVNQDGTTEEEEEEGGEDQEEEEEDERIQSVHAILSIISWGAIADISLIFVRLMRGRRIAFGKVVVPAQLLHSLMMWIVIILSGIATGLIINLNSEELSEVPEESDKGFHFICGLIILFLMLTAIFSGPITIVSMKPYNKTVNKIIGIKWIHRGSGALLYLLAKANIITGVLFHEDGEWEVGVYIYLGILLAVHILIQIMYWYQDKNSNKSPMKVAKGIPTPPEAVSLLEAINKGVSREEIIKNFPKMHWMMLGNGVYNLTDWIHPGGNFIIQACLGREVGRYFYGNHPLEGTTIKPHKHSALTVSQLSTFYIGELSASTYESILVNKKGEESLVSQQSDQWSISKITPLSDTVSEISFQNPNFQVKNFGKSLSWLGRHFRVSFDRNDSLARPYTTALSLNKANYQLRQDIYKYFDQIMQSTASESSPSANFSYDQSYLNNQDSLSIFVKNYASFNGLSSQLHKAGANNSTNRFRVEGPFGRGLELSASSSGTHCIICAGTGILPMIDFLNLLLWKTMYQLIKEKAGVEKAEQINILKIPFDSYFNGLKVKLIGAFANSKEVLGLDIIKKLAEINKKYKTDNFEAMMKGYSDENIAAVNGDFSSAEFLRTMLEMKENKYYVVGPPKLNANVPKALRKLGITHGKIMIV